MAAPSYVPDPVVPSTKGIYTSPRRRLGPWLADRPGEVESVGRYFQGASLGHPGPDQGYVFRLVRLFEQRLRLAEGERRSDVVTGGVAVALKRASLCGRAPVVEDLRVAFDLFGFLSDASDELIARRRELFDGLAGHHNYRDVRRLVDLVPVSALQVGVDSPSA